MIVVLRAISLQFQLLLGLLWMVRVFPTMVLWPSWRLELIVKLCTALLRYQTAVSLVTVASGSFPMEMKFHLIWPYPTTELE